MTQTPQYIDPAEIDIKITELDAPDTQLDFIIPARLVKRIHKKLKKGGHNYNDEEMVSMLSRICVDEGNSRLQRNSVFGPKPLSDAEPPIFKINADFCLSIVIDFNPKIELPDFTSIEIERPIKDVTEEMIDAELYEQRLDAGSSEPHVGKLEYGDDIRCSFKLKFAETDKMLLENEDCLLRIPAPGAPVLVSGFPMLELADELRGSNVGSSISVEVNVPDSFPDPTYRGVPALCSIEILEASRISPSSVDEVVEKYGSPNETVLRTQIKLSLKTRVEREQKIIMINQLFSKLIEEIDFPVSQRIVSDQFQQMMKNVPEPEQSTERSEEEVTKELSDREERLLHRAQLQVQRSTLAAILRLELNIVVGEDDLQEQILVMAESRGLRPEDARQEAMEKNWMGTLFNKALEQRISYRLFEEVQIKDVPYDNKES